MIDYPADPTTYPEYRADLAAKLRAKALTGIVGGKRGPSQLVLDARARQTYQDHDRDKLRDAGRGHLTP